MKAHDVRHLCICKGCNSLGDRREMPTIDSAPWHGSCIFDKIGVEGILELPIAEIKKFTLADIGPKAMKRLVEASSPTHGQSVNEKVK